MTAQSTTHQLPAAALAIPLRVLNTANAREHWAARARRIKSERETVRLYWQARDGAGLRMVADMRPLRVTLVRIGKRTMDSDGVSSALKGVRDEVATLLGVDDKDGTDGVTWHYEQRVAKEYGVLVILESGR